MWRHTIAWTGSTSGTMPDAVSVVPTYTLSEAIFKTKAGDRRRRRRGIWAGCKIHWVLSPEEVATLDSLLAAENADSDATPFTLTLDGTTYRRAGLSKDPDMKPSKDTNSSLDVQLEFEFYGREAGFDAPAHMGAA